MITVNNLFDWMINHGEDVILDGPFRLNEEQRWSFVKRLNNRTDIIEELVPIIGKEIEEISDLTMWVLLVDNDSLKYDILTVFADFVNDEKIEMLKY